METIVCWFYFYMYAYIQYSNYIWIDFNIIFYLLYKHCALLFDIRSKHSLLPYDWRFAPLSIPDADRYYSGSVLISNHVHAWWYSSGTFSSTFSEIKYYWPLAYYASMVWVPNGQQDGSSCPQISRSLLEKRVPYIP